MSELNKLTIEHESIMKEQGKVSPKNMLDLVDTSSFEQPRPSITRSVSQLNLYNKKESSTRNNNNANEPDKLSKGISSPREVYLRDYAKNIMLAQIQKEQPA